ncbi:MAG: SGNH/GDSL hydrolase family protein [Actinobacteria bacterium]|nr:SGNH/GDSL hydrolase family protein [Actinomycetota bacterium]
MAGKVLIVGDSLSGGLPHLSFPWQLRRVNPAWEYLVSARGGDTLAGIGNRLKGFWDAGKYDAVMIEGGGNDIFLPYLEGRGGIWRRFARAMMARGRQTSGDIAAFRDLLARILEGALARTAGVIVTTIPCLGEDLGSQLNATRVLYNQAIREVAGSYGAVLADFGAAYEEILPAAGTPGLYLLEHFRDVFLDTFHALTPHKALALSERRGLFLTIDGLHPNPRGATTLAGTADSALRSLS